MRCDRDLCWDSRVVRHEFRASREVIVKHARPSSRHHYPNVVTAIVEGIWFSMSSGNSARILNGINKVRHSLKWFAWYRCTE